MIEVKTSTASKPNRFRLAASAARYLTGKALTILATIFVGVFLTMLVVNYPNPNFGGPEISPFAQRLETQIDTLIRRSMFNGTFPYDPNGGPVEDQIEIYRQELRAEAGLNLPFLPRIFTWTIKALTFNWGGLDTAYVPMFGIAMAPTSDLPENEVLAQFPNTLLLVGVSYLLVFLIGVPLALYLARRHGSRLDRLVTVLSPISSVPSWVFAILLIALFAVQLRWLPVGTMYGVFTPTDPVEKYTALLKHMVLPVSALVMSLLFQLVYAWRTFFIIYSEEDYVELARAKGLSNRTLESQYILKPALPFIITSFTTSLIGFWQLTVALEKVFDWPGIGQLYIEALPNYRGEAVQIGDLMIVIQIVVIFAYLLGMLVFLLDLVYVIVDPRIHLIRASQHAQVKSRAWAWGGWIKARMKGGRPGRAEQAAGPVRMRAFSLAVFWKNARESLREMGMHNRLFLRELRAYPSAMFGLAVLFILFAGSLYAILALPYEQFGREYDENRVTGRNMRPRVAAPIWFNAFSATPRLSTLILDETSDGVTVSTRVLENGWVEKTITFDFDYTYREAPSDMFLYLDPTYVEKHPFVSLAWTTPDGRVIDLKAAAVGGALNYDFETGIPAAKLLTKYRAWKDWFVTGGQYPTPAYTMLFAGAESSHPKPLQGGYQLKVTTLFFEEQNDLQAQLVLLGQVYGLAGTDYWRRDLVVPLFWGMPFALFIGFLGTLITTLIAMLLPAVGVWHGGWLDDAIQRLTEVNMVLPGLAIAVLLNLLFAADIWIVLGLVVLLNAFGSPIKTFRSAFLQAKQAPYIEAALSYGAGDYRIITRYLVPRILPVFIPQLVTQIPGFIFLEATLGFFTINSEYPSWGRIIYEGLARGALYGSPFWVLEPIFLLLLTGLAFALLGSALERILNPRVLTDMPAAPDAPAAGTEAIDTRRKVRSSFNRKILAGSIAALTAFVIFVPVIQGRTLANALIQYIDETRGINPIVPKPSAVEADTPTPTAASTLDPEPGSPTVTPFILPEVEFTTTPEAIPTATEVPVQLTASPLPPSAVPPTYTLQRGEYPYCIANRFNVDPVELLSLSGLSSGETYFAGTVLTIPQSGRPFPGERMRREHPAVYIVSSSGETLYSIACLFGDVDPLGIAAINNIPIDSIPSAGQPLNIP